MLVFLLECGAISFARDWFDNFFDNLVSGGDGIILVHF